MNILLDKIKANSLSARKNKDKFLSSLLITLISEIEIVGKNARNSETTETETIKVIQKFKKNKVDTIKVLEDRNTSQDIMTLHQKELDIYESYLPSMLSEEVLTKKIEDIINNDSNVNIGKIMGALKKELNGTYDGAMASKIAKKLLP